MPSKQDRIESQYFSLLILAMISYIFPQYEWNTMDLLMKSRLFVCNLKINKNKIRKLKIRQKFNALLTVHQRKLQA